MSLFLAFDLLEMLYKTGWKPLYHLLKQVRSLGIILVASLLLSGCVQSDLSIQFDSPYRGAIVEHIHLGERLSRLNAATAESWLANLEEQAKQLQGKTRRLSEHDISITIPFTNAGDLETKFKKLSQAIAPTSPTPATESNLPATPSQLKLTQSNFLVLMRNHLRYDLDLRSLGVRSDQGELLVSPGSLVDLEFRLQTPWGSRSLRTPSLLQPVPPPAATSGLAWKLQPGQQNHLEAVFWLPNPLGIGAIAITLLVLGGMVLKQRLSPQRES